MQRKRIAVEYYATRAKWIAQQRAQLRADKLSALHVNKNNVSIEVAAFVREVSIAVHRVYGRGSRNDHNDAHSYYVHNLKPLNSVEFLILLNACSQSMPPLDAIKLYMRAHCLRYEAAIKLDARHVIDSSNLDSVCNMISRLDVDDTCKYNLDMRDSHYHSVSVVLNFAVRYHATTLWQSEASAVLYFFYMLITNVSPNAEQLLVSVE